MTLMLAVPIILILAGVIVWTFAEPYISHWKGHRAAERRRMTEGRKRPS